MMFDAVRDLLQTTSLGTFAEEVESAANLPAGIVRPAQLISLTTRSTVAEALKAFAEARILSAPVMNTTSGEYAGFLSTRDVLSALVKSAYPKLNDPGWVDRNQRLSAQELQGLAADFTKLHVQELTHDDDLWYKGDAASTVLDVVQEGFQVASKQLTSKSSQRIHHRIAVFTIVPQQQTPDGPTLQWKVTHVISQSDVVRFLWRHLAKLGPALDKTVQDLGLVQGDVSYVTAELPTLVAFAKMIKQERSSVAVVNSDEAHILVGNLSISDIREVTPESFGTLSLPVGDFLALQHSRERPKGAEEGNWRLVLKGVPLVTCASGTTLKEAIQAVVEAAVHRVYVTDKIGQPIGIITLTDILKLLVS